jgi:hypothetical protein
MPAAGGGRQEAVDPTLTERELWFNPDSGGPQVIIPRDTSGDVPPTLNVPSDSIARHARDRLDDPNITYTVTGGGQSPTGGFNPFQAGNIDPFNVWSTGDSSVPGGIGNVLSFIFGGMGGSGPSPGQPPRLL